MKTAAVTALLVVLALPAPRPASAQRFRQVNLVSDVAGMALHTDANLVNPWGLAPGASGVFWTSNNGTGTSTLYDPDGTPRSLIVNVPSLNPTGIVATSPNDSAFDIPNGATTSRAAFLFVTQSGTISAWSPAVNMTNAIQVASDTGAVYTGAALGGSAVDPLLYVADFKGGAIDAYDSSFTERTLAGNFTDPGLPSGYFPFNISNVGGQLYVTYAQQESPGEELPGAGLGVVSVFDLQGNFVRRFATGGELNAPWAVVRAPASFGPFGGDLLVGNFGDGRILAYDFSSGAFQGALLDTVGNTLAIHGLWGLSFGRAVSGPAVAGRLYFAAGIEGETHGLFGYVAPVAPSDTGAVAACDNASRGAGFWRKICGGPLNGHGGPFDSGKGHGKGHEGEHGHGPFGVDADSLDGLFACISNHAAPNAFGTGGCFTAGCDLLRKVGQRSDSERAAQVLLLTRLNLCSGAVCDSFAVPCFTGEGSDTVRTLGEVADSLDALLCGNGDRAQVSRLAGLLGCVLDSEDGEDRDDGDEDSARKIAVQLLGTNPTRLGDGAVQFSLNAATPAIVQFRIYDVRGRLVAEPLRSSTVVGAAKVTWDGRDLRGRSVSPGTYFYRAVAAGQATTGRLLIVR